MCFARLKTRPVARVQVCYAFLEGGKKFHEIEAAN